MFYILRKNFGDRITNRYFQSFETCKKELDEDVESCCKTLNGAIIRMFDYFNASKGIYTYEVIASFKESDETCSWSIIDGYFED